MNQLLRVIAGLACAGAFAASHANRNGHEHGDQPPKMTTIKIVAINDFHGQLESPGTFRLTAGAAPTVPVGGVDWIAGYISR